MSQFFGRGKDLCASSGLELGDGKRLECFDQFVQAPVGCDGRAEVGGLLRAQGLGDLASVLLVGPGRIVAVEHRKVGPAMATRPGTAGRALRDRSGDDGSEPGNDVEGPSG